MNIPNDRDSIPNSSPDQTEHSLIGILKEKLTTKQTRQSIENYEEGLGKANVILPDCFYDVTKEMSNNAYETRGIMLAKKDIRDEKEMYLVKYLQTIGRWSATSVFPDESRKNAANKLIQYHPELKMIEFHIHPLGTGQFRADKFSEQDYYGIEKQLNKNIDYMHILFTPTHVLTIAKKPTKFLLARNGNQQVMNEYTILQREFNSLLWR